MSGSNSTTLVLGCGPYVNITLFENLSDGTVTVIVDGADGDFDIDGIFFNATDNGILAGLTAFPEPGTILPSGGDNLVTDFDISADSLDTLGNGAQLLDNYDASLQFGTDGTSTAGEVSSVGFTLYNADGSPLSLADIDVSSFAVVVDSDGPDGQVLLVDDTPEDGGEEDDCYDLPNDPPEDCIEVAEGIACVADLNNGTSSAGPVVAVDAELADVVITGSGDVEVAVDKLVNDKNGASDITITDSSGTDIDRLLLSKMGKDDGEADIFRVDLATFDDDFEITIKSEDELDVIVLDNVDSSVQNADGTYSVTYTGADGASHSVTIDPKSASVVIADSDAPGDEGVMYSIAGGADAALFEVDPDTGEVCFIDPPDYENPQDVGGDNVYELVVRTTFEDGSFTEEPVNVCVEDDCIRIEEGETAVVDLDCGTPDIPDLGTDLCDQGGGKPTALTLVYSFDTEIDQVMDQDGDKVGANTFGTDDDGTVFIRVTDKDGNAFFEGEVREGEAFTADNGAKLDSETWVQVYDTQGGTLLQEIEFHTSCSQPLAIGDTFASVQLAGATLEDGSVVGLDPVEAGAGDFGVTYEIVGGEDADLFQVDPETGEVSFINAPDFENPLDADGDNQYHVTVRALNEDGTVCDEYDLDVCVEDDCIRISENSTAPVADLDCGTDPNPDLGLEICAVRDALKDDFDIDTTKPTQLTFALNDSLESVINAGQEGGKLEVDTFALTNADGGGLYVLVSDSSNPGDATDAYFAGDVGFGESFTAVAADGGRDEFGSETFIHVFDQNGGALLQTINYHTSCSAPITIGDQVGLASLQGVALEDKDTGELIEFGSPEAPGDSDVTYAIVGGDDAALFEVDPETGEVSFINPPDYENPLDANADNKYEVTVRATDADGNVCDERALDICVEDELDTPICVAEGETAVADFNLDVACTEEGPDDGVLICQFDGKPIALELAYEFGTGFDQVMDQADDKRDVQTYDQDGDDDGVSYIRVLDKDGNELFADNVAEGDSFVVDNGGDRFDSETFVEIYDDEGGPLLQEIEFHTSCSQPIAIGDAFGSVSLSGATLEGGQSFEGTQTTSVGEGAVIYSISGGADEDAFTVDPETGVVSFLVAPDAAAPDDADGDGVFQVTVRATAEDDPECYAEETIEVEICADPDDAPDMLPIIDNFEDDVLADEDDDMMEMLVA